MGGDEQTAELERLRRNEALYADAQNVAHLGIWEWEVKTGQVVWSLGLYRLYGLSPDRYHPTYEGYLRLVHPEDRGRVRRVIERAAKEKLPFSHDERISLPDSSIRWLHTWGYAVSDQRGRTTGLVGVCQDVTEATVAREAERRSYTLLRTVTEENPNGIFLKDVQGRYLMVNAAGAAFLRNSPEALVGTTDAQWFPPAASEELIRMEARVIASRKAETLEVDIPFADGQRTLSITTAVWLDASGAPSGIVGTIQDATERRRAEAQRDKSLWREHEARLEAELACKRLEFLYEASTVLCASLDLKETIQRVMRVCVPAFADWCSIFLRRPDGAIACVGARHVDASASGALEAFLRDYPPSENESRGVSEVIGSGEGILLTVVTPRNVGRAAYSEEHQRLLQGFGVTSCMILPLRSRKQVFGAVGFFSGLSGRRYLESDRKVGEEFSRMAAIALDNARLYLETQRPEGRPP